MVDINKIKETINNRTYGIIEHIDIYGSFANVELNKDYIVSHNLKVITAELKKSGYTFMAIMRMVNNNLEIKYIKELD